MNSGYFRIITDHLDGEYDGQLWHIIDATEYGDCLDFRLIRGKNKKLSSAMPVKVRLYDDDDILYYTGDTEHEDLLMAIFNYFKHDSGCTHIDQKQKGKWVRLV